MGMGDKGLVLLKPRSLLFTLIEIWKLQKYRFDFNNYVHIWQMWQHS